MGPFNNYQLYALILRLWVNEHPSADWHNQCAVEGIIREVVYPNQNLVWC